MADTAGPDTAGPGSVNVADPARLLVFAGAGISLSPPAGLPLFDQLRDEILCQLGLTRYVWGEADADPRLTDIAAGLVPEPFMLEMARVGIDVPSWLGQVLAAGQPNAQAAAQIAERIGSRLVAARAAELLAAPALAGTAVAGTAVAGTAVAGTAVAGTAVAGTAPGPAGLGSVLRPVFYC